MNVNRVHNGRQIGPPPPYPSPIFLSGRKELEEHTQTDPFCPIGHIYFLRGVNGNSAFVKPVDVASRFRVRHVHTTDKFDSVSSRQNLEYLSKPQRPRCAIEGRNVRSHREHVHARRHLSARISPRSSHLNPILSALRRA